MKVYKITHWPPNNDRDDASTTIGPFTDRAEAERAATTLAARSDVGRVEIATPVGSITLTVYVDAAMAVRALSSACGPIPVRLTDADLAALSPEQRDTMQRHLEGEMGPFADGPHWGERISDRAPLVGVANVATLRVLLDVRRYVMHDAFARADRPTLYAVKIGEDVWSAAMDASDSHTAYVHASRRGMPVQVRRIDGPIVGVAGGAFTRGETVDVVAGKIWARVAAGAVASGGGK